MKNLKGTKTAECLARAFAGESQARNRYTFFYEIATQQKQDYIAHVFDETAKNEKAHAKVFYDFLIKGLGSCDIHVDAHYPIELGTIEENLKAAADGEHDEWSSAYKEFSEIAVSEGFPEISTAFKNIASIEKTHEERFLDVYDKMKSSTLFTSDTPKLWKCRNCGYILESKSAPAVCPVCKYPQGFYEVHSQDN